MTREQLEALVELVEVLSIEAVYQVTAPGLAREEARRSVIRRVYEVFGVEPNAAGKPRPASA